MCSLSYTFTFVINNLCNVSISATIPLDVMAHFSVNLVVFEKVLEIMEYPSEIRVSAAIVTKSLPAIAIKIIENLVNTRKLIVFALTNSCTEVVSIWVELMLNWIFMSSSWDMIVAWFYHIMRCSSSVLFLISLLKDVSLSIVFQIHF